jgi:hypothetical protein
MVCGAGRLAASPKSCCAILIGRRIRGYKKHVFLVQATTESERDPARRHPRGGHGACACHEPLACRRHQHRGILLPGIRVPAGDALSVEPGAASAAARLHAAQIVQVQIQAFQRPPQRPQTGHRKRAVSKCADTPCRGGLDAGAPIFQGATGHRRALTDQAQAAHRGAGQVGSPDRASARRRSSSCR